MLYLISLLSFLLPTQLALHLDRLLSTSVAGQTMYTVYGFSIDYLIPTLYLTDIIAILIIIFGIRNYRITKRFVLFATLYLFFASLNIFISSYFISSLYKWFKVTEMILLGIVIINTKKFDVFKNFIKPLSYSIFIICILGIWQVLIKGSVGGVFYLLGERTFDFINPNISPYPYSTFSHPNSFAGFLLVFGLFVLKYKERFQKKYFWFLSLLILTNLILTNSLNVYLTIVFLILFKTGKGLLYAIWPIDFGARYITHRIELIQASFKMIKDHFWFGVGLNNFIPNLVKVSNTFVNSWELQPVHNIFLLTFSETGVIGFLVFCFLIFSALSVVNYPLIAIVVSGMSDHYWLTLQQNMLLFTYVWAISKRK